jgi:hypothetical protein
MGQRMGIILVWEPGIRDASVTILISLTMIAQIEEDKPHKNSCLNITITMYHNKSTS